MHATEDKLTADPAAGSAVARFAPGLLEELARHRFCFSGLTAESNTRPYANASESRVFTGDTPELEAQNAQAPAPVPAASGRCKRP